MQRAKDGRLRRERRRRHRLDRRRSAQRLSEHIQSLMMMMLVVVVVVMAALTMAKTRRRVQTSQKFRYLQRLAGVIDRQDRVMQTLCALLVRVTLARISAKD